MNNNSSPRPSHVGGVVGFLVFVELISGIVQGFYVPLIGRIARVHAVTDADVTWFVTVQTLSAAVCVPVLSKLGDIFGHRRMLRIAVVLVALGTGLVAFAPDFTLVLLGRILVGPLAVWLPLEVALVHSRLDQEDSRRAIGMLASALTLGALVGALLSGVLAAVTTSLSVVLAVPFIATLACAVIVFTKVPETTVRTAPSIDGVGFAGLALAMIAILSGLNLAKSQGFAAASTLAVLAVAVLLLIGWVIWELRATPPAVDLRMMTSRALWPVYVTSFLFGILVFGMQTIGPTFLAADPSATGYGFSLQPAAISGFSAASTALSVLGASTFAWFARRIGIKSLLLVATGLGVVSNLILVVGWSALLAYFVATALSGISLGLLLGALPALIAERSPSDQTAIATGLYNTLKTVGGSIAGAVFAVVLAAFFVPEAGASSIGGYQIVWGICAAGFVVSSVALLFTPATTTAPAAVLKVKENA
ncbi:Major Facilitator Superfamily protein [Propionibacterium cyclohexanicum]|uniref:Major Facilitator Superfamily protein n=1 Tax=Propionibacterium cyclohexanicum TaxID=64702 RepID=A0A1H9PFU2_9ACTN|nr:MFS transporter [Propionibacterium cyclohexanicum]SER46970.1 Major Facilitator Superfamily protein [Propionibacterium cyclohexanicum]